MIVVDASLAAKWFLDEADTVSAKRFLWRYGYTIIVPDLLLSEVASAIVRRGNTEKQFDAQARTSLADWRQLQDDEIIEIIPMTSRLVEKAGLLALDLGHPIADCVYLQLAIERDCELATCDAKFRTKAGRRYDRIRLLHQFDD